MGGGLVWWVKNGGWVLLVSLGQLMFSWVGFGVGTVRMGTNGKYISTFKLFRVICIEVHMSSTQGTPVRSLGSKMHH